MTISTLSGKRGDPYFYLRNEDIEAIKNDLDILDSKEFMSAREKILDKMQPKLNSLQSKWGGADIGNLYFIDYISFEISSLLNEIEEKYAHNNIKEPLSKAILNCRQVLLYLYSFGTLKKRDDINPLQLRELTENQSYNFNDLIKILRTMIKDKIPSLLFSQGSKGIRLKDSLQRTLDKNKNEHYDKLKNWFDNYIEPFSVENFQEFAQEELNEKLFFHITLYTQPQRLPDLPENLTKEKLIQQIKFVKNMCIPNLKAHQNDGQLFALGLEIENLERPIDNLIRIINKRSFTAHDVYTAAFDLAENTEEECLEVIVPTYEKEIEELQSDRWKQNNHLRYLVRNECINEKLDEEKGRLRILGGFSVTVLAVKACHTFVSDLIHSIEKYLKRPLINETIQIFQHCLVSDQIIPISNSQIQNSSVFANSQLEEIILQKVTELKTKFSFNEGSKKSLQAFFNRELNALRSTIVQTMSTVKEHAEKEVVMLATEGEKVFSIAREAIEESALKFYIERFEDGDKLEIGVFEEEIIKKLWGSSQELIKNIQLIRMAHIIGFLGEIDSSEESLVEILLPNELIDFLVLKDLRQKLESYVSSKQKLSGPKTSLDLQKREEPSLSLKGKEKKVPSQSAPILSNSKSKPLEIEMSFRLPSKVKVRDFIKLINDLGFEVVNGKNGSHRHIVNDAGHFITTLPQPKPDGFLAAGTQKAINNLLLGSGSKV